MTSVERQFERFRRGDPIALGLVFDALAPELLGVAMHVSRGADEAEDLVQQTFLTAIEQRDRYESGRPLMPWLSGILANHSRNAVRKRRDSSELPEVSAPPGETRGELREEVARVLGKVGPPYREVLALHLIHGLSAAEIAHALGRAPGTVRSQITRGTRLVRHALPASCFAAVLGAPSVRGLQSIRRFVMSRAEIVVAVPAAAGLIGIIGAFLMTKQVTIGLVAGLAIAAGFMFFASDEGDALLVGGGDGAGAAENQPARRAEAVEKAPVAVDAKVAADEETSAKVESPVEITVDGASILGTVVIVAGGPAPGVTVSAAPMRNGTWLEESIVAATTGEDGRFALVGLDTGRYVLSTASARFAPTHQSVTIQGIDDRVDVELSVRRGAAVRGRVVDDLGRAVPDAKVAPLRRRRLSDATVARSATTFEAVSTDESGGFTIEGLDRDRAVVRAWKDGLETVVSVVEGIDGSSEIVLRRLGSVHGIVTAPAGEPITNCPVQLLFTGASGTGKETETTTGTDGRFEILAVTASEVTLSARPAGFRPIRGVKVDVAPGESTDDVRLVAEEGTRLVVIVDGVDGAKVSGAVVKLLRERARPPGIPADVRMEKKIVAESVTADDGRAIFEGLRAERIEVKVTHDIQVQAERPIVLLPPSGTLECRASLAAGAWLAVSVEDQDGSPLAAPFRVTRPGGSGGMQRTSADGTGRVGPLQSGAWTCTLHHGGDRKQGVEGTLTLFAEPPAVTGTKVELLLDAGEEKEVVLTRPRLCRITGTVRGGGGPISGVKCILEDASDQDPFALGIAEATTRDDGSFVMDDLLPGTYDLSYGVSGDPTRETTRVELDSAGLTRHLELELPSGSIRLRVVSPDGAGLGRAKVAARRMGSDKRGRKFFAPGKDGSTTTIEFRGGISPATTDGDGYAALPRVAAGKWRVEVSAAGYIPVVLEDVEVGRAIRELGRVALVDAAILSARIVDASGAAIPFAIVKLDPEGGGEARRLPVSNGLLLADDLRPGRYSVTAKPFFGPTSGPESEPTAITLTAGRPLDVTIIVE